MQPDSDTLALNAVELGLLPGMGPRTQSRILRSVQNVSELFSMGTATLRSIGVAEVTIPAIRARAYKQSAKEILTWAAKEQCSVIPYGSQKYPALLSEIADPPIVLYALGSLKPLQMPGIAIVGSRRPTLYGLQAARSLASELAERGICVVSGLARGIDAAAHGGCLQTGGSTLAVLGCGIDTVYPPEHRQLKEKIAASGTVLSEFPPGTPPAPHNFPIRNRIISGLSLGSVIVEAREKSGSLITARLALEQNREVFAIPGNIFSPSSFGPNFLIKQGAKLVQSWKDVMEEMPPSLKTDIFSKCEAEQRNIQGLDTLSDKEKKILSLLKMDAATHFDKLFLESGCSIPDLSEQLMNLELKGLIRRLPGDMYIR
jgi:DNA processing protein